MTERADPGLLDEIRQYGDVEIEACFNCGNCTAVCPLSSDATPFPRSNIRMVQLGLRDRLLASPDPWLCYYCGDCAATCPRNAEPGEAQMTLRRWLTAQYDWTGLARRFYTSWKWELGAVLFVAALVVALFAAFHGPMVTERVELNTFAPAHVVEILDWAMLALLSAFLLSNVFRMYQFTLRGDPSLRIPLSLYVTEAKELLVHFATQRRWAECETEPRKGFVHQPLWRNHWILVSGYVTMFILIVVFLRWFQTDEIYPIWHPQRWIGYYATVALLFGAGAMLWGRYKKASQMHRFSHLSDWLFPILLVITTVTGILVHAFRYMGLPMATYYTYVVHLAVLVPMLVLEVPFGKWSHLAYRPFAIYFQAVKEKAAATVPSEAEMGVATP